mgnify:CR=1 FL=1
MNMSAVYLLEIVFGKVFWDYSKIPFNLGGRIICCTAFSGGSQR